MSFLDKNISFASTIVRWMWVGFVLFLGFIGLVAWAVHKNPMNLFGQVPPLETLENPPSSFSSELISEDGEVIGRYFRENRAPVEYDDISQNMLKALYATEDIRFEEHSGIDFKGTLAIMWYLIRLDNRGSSTLTQQLAKNLFKTRTASYDGVLTKVPGLRTIIFKVKEWITAIRLEKSYTKHEIVSMYLNTVDFGSGSNGIRVAANTFFSKDQKDLSLEEAAMLAGLLKAPSYYSPVLHPDNALRRRNTVLNQINKYDLISDSLCTKLKSQPISLQYKVESHNSGMATYFRKICSDYLMAWCKEHGYDLYGDGLKIYTTINAKMQRYAEEAMESHMAQLQSKFFQHWKGRKPWSMEENGVFKEMPGFLYREIKKTDQYKMFSALHHGDSIKIDRELRKIRKMRVFTWQGEKDTLMNQYDSLAYYLHFLHTGFMAMDPTNGEIRAWIGGINHKYFKYDHVRQGARQPGSTFKPIVYSTIMSEAGDLYSPCYKVVDAPVTFYTGDPNNPTWTPQNSDGKYTGESMTLRQALAQSVNSVTAYMMKTMGDDTPEKVVDMARNLGITTPLEAVPAICLGTYDVSVFELTGAYSTFANKGVYNKPFFISRIEDKNGNVIAQFTKDRKVVMSEKTAYTMLYMLRGATEERNGTGLGLNRYGLLGGGNQIGAKTGTTQNYSDGWFMGVTPKLVAGCWVGGDHRSIHFRSIDLGQGARMAMPIFGAFMQKVYSDPSLNIPRARFAKPEGMPEFNCSGTSTDTSSTPQQIQIKVRRNDDFDD